MKPAVAFVISPLAVAVLAPMAIEGQIMLYPPVVFVVSLFVVYAFTLVFAVPVYLAIPRKYKHRLLPLALTAFFTAALSFILVSLPTRGSSAQVGQVLLIQNGSLTLEGWKSLLQLSFFIGAAGLVSALVFWLFVRSGNE